MKNILLTAALACVCAMGLRAQEYDVHRNPSISQQGMAPYRTEFISYSVREHAEQRANGKNEYYLPLKLEKTQDRVYAAVIDVPYMWLDRDVFVRIQGAPQFYLVINGQMAGYGEDSRTPAEYNISQYLSEKVQIAVVTMLDGSGMLLEPEVTAAPTAYIFSQPKLRIEDYIVTAPLDSTGNFANFEIKVAVANSYNFEEKVTIGYDLYTPEGKIKEYSIREVVIPGQGRDTVVFSEKIYGAKERLWSAETPKMYYGILSVRRDGRMIEYVPYRIGFGETTFADGKVLRNGKPVNIKAARYNATSEKMTEAQLSIFKHNGYNTICPDYPQPAWFYDLTENIGLYVIDQANITPWYEPVDRKHGSSLNNDPELLGSYTERMRAMYGRNKNRTSVIGWSLGGDAGNGYNMYKSYQLLKSLDDSRAVVYRGARGEWNSDIAITFDK